MLETSGSGSRRRGILVVFFLRFFLLTISLRLPIFRCDLVCSSFPPAVFRGGGVRAHITRNRRVNILRPGFTFFLTTQRKTGVLSSPQVLC